MLSLTTLFTETVGSWVRGVRVSVEKEPEFPDVSSAAPDIRRLIRDRRYCRVLCNQNQMPLDDDSVACAWKAVEFDMALVPAGEVRLDRDLAVSTPYGLELVSADREVVPVETTYLDRHCVTNEQFARFVQADGYTDPAHWPEGVLPNVLQFVDTTGRPGPSHWIDGAPPKGKQHHPVVGVCWYEANAYATWVGKRLPMTTQWQRAGTWPRARSGKGGELRYPWGNAFDPRMANTWAGGHADTVPVRSYSASETPNGVRQLIGNVWEWVDAQFYPNAAEGVTVHVDHPMAEIRGGAYDTYFASHATCQFRSGQPLLYRGINVGFRCCIAAGSLPLNPNNITT